MGDFKATHPGYSPASELSREPAGDIRIEPEREDADWLQISVVDAVDGSIHTLHIRRREVGRLIDTLTPWR